MAERWLFRTQENRPCVSLKPDALDGRQWIYRESPVMAIDKQAAARFDEGLEPMEKAVLPYQEVFYIHSQSIIP